MLKSLLGLAAVAAVSVSLLGGCAQELPNAYHREIVPISYPDVYQLQTVMRGDRIVAQGMYIKGEFLRITEPYIHSMYQIPAGDYLKSGEDDEDVIFIPVTSNGAAVTWSPLADPVIGLAIDKRASQDDPEREVCVKTNALGFAVKYCRPYPYLYGKLTTISPADLHKAIIFAKIEGDIATFYYQERLRNEVIRDEHFDVNLSEQKIFGYAGALIEVESYTPTSMTYKLISNFKSDNHIVSGTFERL